MFAALNVRGLRPGLWPSIGPARPAVEQASSGCPAPLGVRLLESVDTASIARQWQALEREFGGGAIANSWAWTGAWLKHFGDATSHWFAIGEAAGRVVGIALVTSGVNVRRGPFPIRTIHIGTAGEATNEGVRVEYNRLLVDPRFRESFARGVVESIDRSSLKWDELVFDGFAPDDGATLADVSRATEVELRVCPVADLQAIRAENGRVQDALRRHTAAKIRRTSRRLEETFGPLTVEWANSLADAHCIFDELKALHQDRWLAAGKLGLFASRRFAGFHQEVVDTGFPLGKIVLARVKAGDQTIGCDYGLVENGRILAYQWGLARFDDGRLSPGLVVGALVMQAALERGFDEYDWLAGDVLYKRELSTTQRELIWARAPRSVRVHLIDRLAWAKRRTEAARASFSARLNQPAQASAKGHLP